LSVFIIRKIISTLIEFIKYRRYNKLRNKVKSDLHQIGIYLNTHWDKDSYWEDDRLTFAFRFNKYHTIFSEFKKYDYKKRERLSEFYDKLVNNFPEVFLSRTREERLSKILD
jgi:hypothetical protein